MVTRKHEEKRIDFSLPTTGNAWYGLIPEISDALTEIVGAEVKSSTASEAVFTLPDWPGDLRVTAPTGASTSASLSVYLRDAAESTIYSGSFHMGGTVASSRLIGVLIIGVNIIGDFLHNIYIGSPGGNFVGVKWSWFASDTDKEIYWFPVLNSGVTQAVADGLYSSGSNLYMPNASYNLYSSDLAQKYKVTITGNAQDYHYYPHNPDARILCPILIAARNSTTGEDLGYLRWGGEYMLYILNRYNSEANIAVESGVKYEINGQTYVACGTTMLIPERWPFKEEGGA